MRTFGSVSFPLELIAFEADRTIWMWTPFYLNHFRALHPPNGTSKWIIMRPLARRFHSTRLIMENILTVQHSNSMGVLKKWASLNFVGFNKTKGCLFVQHPTESCCIKKLSIWKVLRKWRLKQISKNKNAKMHCFSVLGVILLSWKIDNQKNFKQYSILFNKFYFKYYIF